MAALFRFIVKELAGTPKPDQLPNTERPGPQSGDTRPDPNGPTKKGRSWGARANPRKKGVPPAPSQRGRHLTPKPTSFLRAPGPQQATLSARDTPHPRWKPHDLNLLSDRHDLTLRMRTVS